MWERELPSPQELDVGEGAAFPFGEDPLHAGEVRGGLGQHVDPVAVEALGVIVVGTQVAPGEAGVEGAQARAYGLAEDVVAKSRELVGVEHQAVDDGAVEEERAAPQAVLGVQVHQGLDGKPLLHRAPEVEGDPAIAPLRHPREIAQLAAVVAQVEVRVLLETMDGPAHPFHVAPGQEARTVEGLSGVFEEPQLLAARERVGHARQGGAGGVGLVFEGEAGLEYRECDLGVAHLGEDVSQPAEQAGRVREPLTRGSGRLELVRRVAELGGHGRAAELVRQGVDRSGGARRVELVDAGGEQLVLIGDLRDALLLGVAPHPGCIFGVGDVVDLHP